MITYMLYLHMFVNDFAKLLKKATYDVDFGFPES